jgi:hypothetical protein
MAAAAAAIAPDAMAEEPDVDPQKHSADPRERARQLRERLVVLQDSLRAEVDDAGEPRFKALLETSAEVLGGLGKSFEDYAAKNEAAWR